VLTPLNDSTMGFRTRHGLLLPARVPIEIVQPSIVSLRSGTICFIRRAQKYSTVRRQTQKSLEYIRDDGMILLAPVRPCWLGGRVEPPK
jgi:hypothetical protein